MIAFHRPSEAHDGQRQSLIARQRAETLENLTEDEFSPLKRWARINAVAGVLSEQGLKILRESPEVRRIDLDRGGTGALEESVNIIGARLAHQHTITGQGIRIAVLDTGVDTTHPDLIEAVVDQACFCDLDGIDGCCPNGQISQFGQGSATDDHGHGTHVAGILASNGSIASSGVAPDAELVAVKVLDENNEFFFGSTIISALEWLATEHPEVKIVNLSLGSHQVFSGYCDTETALGLAYAEIVEVLQSQNTTVFAASGNHGSTEGMAMPACIHDVFSVAAVFDSTFRDGREFGCEYSTVSFDDVLCSSNTNETLDFFAPGASIISSWPGETTRTINGTSQASPHAAGVAALVLQAEPTLTPDGLYSILESTGDLIQDDRTGITRPKINALNALRSLGAIPADADNNGCACRTSGNYGFERPVLSVMLLLFVYLIRRRKSA